MRPSKLTAGEIELRAKETPGWELDGDVIRRTFKFQDFLQAMAFVNRLAEAAEGMQHHPDIDIRYDRVSLALSTHDAGGLTAFDFDLAKAADGLA